MTEYLEADIETLMKGRIEIERAFRSNDSIRYGELGKKYGLLARSVYMKLDKESKEVGFFDGRPALLDPFTVMNRTSQLLQSGRETGMYSEELWMHSDMIKSLCDYIELLRRDTLRDVLQRIDGKSRELVNN